MSLNGVIAVFATPGSPYTRTRTTPGTTVDGIYTEGAVVQTPISGSLQPVTGSALKSLPEGRHASELKVFYTTTNVIATPIPDRLTINGEQWEVSKVDVWEAFGEIHYNAYVSRLPVP